MQKNGEADWIFGIPSPKSLLRAWSFAQYRLGILDESAKNIRGKVSLARLEDALAAQHYERCDNKVYQSLGRYVILSSKTQSRRRWPTDSPLAKRSGPAATRPIPKLLHWRMIIDPRFHRLIYLFRREEHRRLHPGRAG
jgi:hypothetical protein